MRSLVALVLVVLALVVPARAQGVPQLPAEFTDALPDQWLSAEEQAANPWWR